MSYYLHHIFYYILYKKYRILVSNAWIEVERNNQYTKGDWTYYNSSNGKYYIQWYHNISYFTIHLTTSHAGDPEIKFKINDGINGHVCAFFMENHKVKIIKSEDELAYKRNIKLNELGI